MPFIRYRQGDVGRWAEGGSVCGRSLPTMAIIEGRLGDFVTLPSGRQLSPHHFFIALDTAAGVARWRLLQEAVDRLRVEVVASGGGDDQIEQTIRHGLQEITGEGVEIDIARVERLAIDPAQKFRSVISWVGRPPAPGGDGRGAGGDR
jgi:phenylacetate-CoA ligase